MQSEKLNAFIWPKSVQLEQIGYERLVRDKIHMNAGMS